MATKYAHLGGGASGTFDSMMKNGFGIVTVMNAKFYDFAVVNTGAHEFKNMTADEIRDYLLGETPLCEIDTLKVANVTTEGPTKTITGGQYVNPLIKYGKTARLEMQDALGRAAAIEALCGGIREWDNGLDGGEDNPLTGLHFGQDFTGPKVILGDSFFIDRDSGKQVKVNILFYQMLPDAIFNLTQDAEGDATVFDMNGDLAVTEIQVGTENGNTELHGLFYSILPAASESDDSSGE